MISKMALISIVMFIGSLLTPIALRACRPDSPKISYSVCEAPHPQQIRTTLTMIPWRGLQLSTKHLALAIISIPVAFIIAASGVLYTFIVMRDIAVVIEIDTMIDTLVGTTDYLTLTTFLSAAIGAFLRRTTFALVILLGYYFIFSPLMRVFLPSIEKYLNYFPDTAGNYMYVPSSPDEINVLTPMQGTGILILWTLIFIAVAIVFYRERDA
jgi:ABC-2 type transport system permease protein